MIYLRCFTDSPRRYETFALWQGLRSPALRVVVSLRMFSTSRMACPAFTFPASHREQQLGSFWMVGLAVDMGHGGGGQVGAQMARRGFETIERRV